MDIKIIDFQKSKALSIVQFITEQVDSFNYISLSSAINNNLIELKEVNDQGNVNNIFVVNNSDHYVFIMDGDVLIGAKQNRVVNASILLEPHSKLKIPVSCVEAGRWNFSSFRFSDSDYTASPRLRAEKSKDIKKSLDEKKGFYASQSKVWRMVSHHLRSSDTHSFTEDFSEIFERKKEYFDDFTRLLRYNSDSNGMAMFINTELISIDVFNRKDIYKEYFPKIIKGVATEAYNVKEENELFTDTEANFQLIKFFDHYNQIEKTKYKSIGAGFEKRYNDDQISGFELEYQGKLIHLAIFWQKYKLA